MFIRGILRGDRVAEDVCDQLRILHGLILGVLYVVQHFLFVTEEHVLHACDASNISGINLAKSTCTKRSEAVSRLAVIAIREVRESMSRIVYLQQNEHTPYASATYIAGIEYEMQAALDRANYACRVMRLYMREFYVAIPDA